MNDSMTRPAYVIVGATGGIGSQLCRRLTVSGANLLLAARDSKRLAELAEELNGIPNCGRVEVKATDATDSNQVDSLFAEATSRFGAINGAVNLVGSILLKPAHLTTDEEFETTLNLNLRTAFYVLRDAAKAMLATGGSIVLASSVATKIGLVNHEAIAAAKGGINGLVLSAAATYAGRNIRVNAVAPGLVRTPLAAKLTSNEASLKASMAMHPLGRIGEPDDVASAIAWLLDPKTTWVTGQILGIDGGLGSVRTR